MRRNVLVLLLATASAPSIVFCSPPVRLVTGAESLSRPPFTATVLAILYYWYFLDLVQPTTSRACTFDATAVSGTFTTTSSNSSSSSSSTCRISWVWTVLWYHHNQYHEQISSPLPLGNPSTFQQPYLLEGYHTTSIQKSLKKPLSLVHP
jgi:hypothetical protein